MATGLVSTSGALILALAWALGPRPASAVATPAAARCYLVGDANAREQADEAEETLILLNGDDPDPATDEITLGTGTGSRDIESLAFLPGTEVLFAVDGGVLGTLDLPAGRFTARATGIGGGSGRHGRVEFHRVQGLAFDPRTGWLYASERTGREDLLLRIEPATGALVPHAFGDDDYAVIQPVGPLADIDDITIDPADGQMYAIANDDGAGDQLVKVDTASGGTSAVGPLGASDMEGLSFAPDGRLFGVTGGVTGRQAFWKIDKQTGAAGDSRPLDKLADYEAVACLAAAVPPPPAAARLVIAEDTRPDSSERFSFNTSGGPLPGTFELPDGGNWTYASLPAGNYTVSQAARPDWPLQELSCTDASSGTTTDVATATAAISLAPGDEVTCLWVNVQGIRTPSAIPASLERPALVVAAELPRTGRLDRWWTVLAGTLLTGGGLGILLAAWPARGVRWRR